ncbi:GNAT family N-acetyltransferase [Pseudomonas cichorii]|uniref:GNAT family N-acetyltransferase n=1 Tax=Pseudomonas cichorii TaxID=36746 RepID=UPI0018E5C320|nr:GNAT family N-acetyltransferase [Pseudomonas cichorii]MBI6853485.1 GNAT family N-acetyltransferase [Pseudomonas cichorii]
MDIQIKIANHFEELPLYEIEALTKTTNAPFFYDARFLKAAHYSPLLPILSAYYILAYSHDQLVGFTVLYSQLSPDPFGSLSRATGLNFNDKPACLGHIMHGYESEIVVSAEHAELTRRCILKSIKELGNQVGAHHVGLINVVNCDLLLAGTLEGYQTSFMWDRYYMDITCIETVEDYISQLPADGRREMNRQQRKLQLSDQSPHVQTLASVNVMQIAELVCETSSRHGTPDYYPPAMLKSFLETCADLVRFISIQKDDQVIGVMVCFLSNNTLHIWAAGMSYDHTDFSPYSACMLEAFRYAKEQGLHTIEIGRTNHKIKTRMGFKAKELFSLVASA